MASRDGILDADPDKRPFVLTRSNFLGGHRYAATWTGENASDPALMKMSIPMTINLGFPRGACDSQRNRIYSVDYGRSCKF